VDSWLARPAAIRHPAHNQSEKKKKKKVACMRVELNFLRIFFFSLGYSWDAAVTKHHLNREGSALPYFFCGWPKANFSLLEKLAQQQRMRTARTLRLLEELRYCNAASAYVPATTSAPYLTS
jgi:hypothetical protein